MNTINKFLFGTVLMTLALVAQAATVTNVKYIDADGSEKTCPEATLVVASGSRVTWNAGWYVVTNEVTVTGGADCSGAVHLILADTGALTISGVASGNAGIKVSGSNNSLAIYGQSAGTGVLDVKGGQWSAGIGGGDESAGSNITINGGTVTATGGTSGAGIGGGYYASGSNITINGGMVTATGASAGAGIGGGNCGAGSNITINGGTVTATGDGGAGVGGGGGGAGSNITINGGTVTAKGGNGAAGIGGGENELGSNITINGGTVTANGGNSGAGIGGGFKGVGSNIAINGGTVTATGISGAGIGGGDTGAGSNITINGGTVTATDGGTGGAGIGGGCEGAGSNITISGGTVTANGGNYGGVGIGGGDSGPSSDIYAADDVIVKAGNSANPTDEIVHLGTQDIADGLAGKRYVTMEAVLPPEPIPSSVTAPDHATAKVYTNKVVDAQYESTDGTVWSNRLAKVVYTVNSDKDWYFKGDVWIKAITNELDTTVNPAVDTNDLPAIVEVTCERKVVKTNPDPFKPEEVQSPYVLKEGFTYRAAPATGPDPIDGGVFNVHSGATLTGTNVTFASNKASYGGAICNAGTVALKGATFTGNKATLDSAGTIINDGSATLTLDDVTFEGNEAQSSNPGAIYNDGTVNLDGFVTLKTETDTICNEGTLNWNLTDGKAGILDGYEKLTNDDGVLQLTVENYAATTNFVIATGDFTDVIGKDTFLMTNVTFGATATITIDGGAVCLGSTWWSLAVEGGNKLVLKTVETVTLSDVMTGVATNASEAVVSVLGQTVEEESGTYKVPKGCEVTVAYTAKDDYMFAGGAKTKTVTVGPLAENYAMTDADKPVAEAQWVDVREIALDTRERIVVAAPEEVLPIAYSTNFWGEAEGHTMAEVRFLEPGSEEDQLLIDTNENGYVEWKPAVGAFGKYEFTHICKGGEGIQKFNASIIYSSPFPLTITQPTEGGAIVAITNGVEATGTFDVLGFENVTIAAKPAEHWQLKEMAATTNGVALVLDEAKTSLTNKFEMPCSETVVTGVFVIAETYRAELKAGVDDKTTASKEAIDAMKNNRLTEDEVAGFKALVDNAATDAKTAIDAATKPYTADAATNTLAVALKTIGSDAKKLSDSKPYEFVIASDFAANPPFENILTDDDGNVTNFTYAGRSYVPGISAYTTFTDAFTNETYGAFATNLHVFGAQTIAQEPAMVAKWNLDLVTYEGGEAIPAIVSVDPTKTTPSVLFNFTNTLAHIVGQGTILLGKTDVPTTVYDDFIAERPEIENIIVKNVGVEPTKDGQNVKIEVNQSARTETTEEGETAVVLPGVENLTGNIELNVDEKATNDVLVAGTVRAPAHKVTILNDSTNEVRLTSTVEAKEVEIVNYGNVGDAEGSILAAEVVAAEAVTIYNNAHLEANVDAGGNIKIFNNSSKTIVGTYDGATVSIKGGDEGAISNVTFVSDGSVEMKGVNILTGPFTITAPTVVNESRVIFSVSNDNHTTWLNDFNQIVGTGSFEVKVDAAQTDGDVVGVYTIASNATTAAGKSFALAGGSVSTTIAVAAANAAEVEAKTLYIGAKAYSLVVDANGALVFTVKYGKFAITYDAMGPYFTAGETTVVSDSYVHIGYSLPADPVREGYVFGGWYDGVTNGAPVAVSGSSLLYIREHTVFARWTVNGGVPVAALSLAADGMVTPSGNVGNNLVLPDTIDGKPVLMIGKAAFAAANYKASSITNLVTGVFLRSIEPGAFNQVTTLKTLKITEARDFDNPSTVVPVTIGKRAFAGTRIESLEIAEGTIIGEQAFRGCSYLKEIAFFGDAANASLTAANVDAFTLCGYANGTGKIKLYMSDAFNAANAAFVTALKNSYAASNVEIEDIAGYSPATSVSISGLDVSQPTEMSLRVSADALIKGTFAYVSKIKILYRENLADAEREYDPTSVVQNPDGTYTLKFVAPNAGRNGFMRVEVR